jgi:hypothetical protein
VNWSVSQQKWKKNNSYSFNSFDSTKLVHKKPKTQSPFNVLGYIETHYSYDFGEPDNHVRPDFYSHNKHNEVNNLGLAKVNMLKRMFSGILP